jgi:predicted flap endonuclease-1-like 5' DNA nuclease
MTRLIKIEGIGETYAQRLEQAGLSTIEELLEHGASPKGRTELVEKTGISATLILKWVNRADLVRVKGIGEEYADLLEAAGVDTVPELAQRNPQNLYPKLAEVNAVKKLVRRVPALSQVEDWVAQAKDLPRKVTY